MEQSHIVARLTIRSDALCVGRRARGKPPGSRRYRTTRANQEEFRSILSAIERQVQIIAQD